MTLQLFNQLSSFSPSLVLLLKKRKGGGSINLMNNVGRSRKKGKRNQYFHNSMFIQKRAVIGVEKKVIEPEESRK